MADKNIGAILMNALGLGPQKPQQPVLTPEEEAAPWNVKLSGSGGAPPQGGSMMAPAQAAPQQGTSLDDLDALIMEIKRQKQKASMLGGQRPPQ